MALNIGNDMIVLVLTDPSAQEFTENLLLLKYFVVISHNQDGCIAMETDERIVKNQEDLIQEVLPNDAQNIKD